MDGASSRPRPKRARLTRSGDFDAVYRRGRSSAGRHLVLYAFRREDAAHRRKSAKSQDFSAAEWIEHWHPFSWLLDCVN